MTGMREKGTRNWRSRLKNKMPKTYLETKVEIDKRDLLKIVVEGYVDLKTVSKD